MQSQKNYDFCNQTYFLLLVRNKKGLWEYIKNDSLVSEGMGCLTCLIDNRVNMGTRQKMNKFERHANPFLPSNFEMANFLHTIVRPFH